MAKTTKKATKTEKPKDKTTPKKRGGKSEKKTTGAATAQGQRSFKEIRDNKGRMINTSLARFILQLVAKAKKYNPDDYARPDVYKAILPDVLKITKDPEQLEKLKKFASEKQIELRLGLRAAIRRAQTFKGEILIKKPNGEYYRPKSKAETVKILTLFEKKVKENTEVAYVLIQTVERKNQLFFMLR